MEQHRLCLYGSEVSMIGVSPQEIAVVVIKQAIRIWDLEGEVERLSAELSTLRREPTKEEDDGV